MKQKAKEKYLSGKITLSQAAKMAKVTIGKSKDIYLKKVINLTTL